MVDHPLNVAFTLHVKYSTTEDDQEQKIKAKTVRHVFSIGYVTRME